MEQIIFYEITLLEAGRSGGILCEMHNDALEGGAFEQGDYMLKMNLWDRKLK